MMEGIRERLRIVREHWGWSARKASLEMGLNASAWAGYESGENLPGAAVLCSLTQREVDLHWLLTGEGRMIRERDPEDLPALVDQVETHQRRTIGLGRAALLAQRSNFDLRLHLLDLLVVSFPRALTLDEVIAESEIDRVQCGAALLELVDDGLVEVIAGAAERYKALGSNAIAIADTTPDQNQLGMEIIKFIAADVLPKVHKPGSPVVLLDATAHLINGRAFLTELRQFLISRSTEMHAENGDVVKLVLAAEVMGRGTDKADR